MHIAVFGLGYVGLVSAACLASEGHIITGIDVSPDKVTAINRGETPIVEPGIAERISTAVREGKLSASNVIGAALKQADLAFICVGTPTLDDGGIDTRAVESVICDLATFRSHSGRALPIVIRSTIPIGTVRGQLLPLYQTTSGLVNEAPPIVFHPEFLREGCAVADYYDPARVVVGEAEPNSKTGDVLLQLYRGFSAPVFRIDYESAELLKYCDNVFHALKISFANEVGLLAHSYGIDSRELMAIFCADKKLNISEKYLAPRFAYGGSCLPKDIRGFLDMARAVRLSLPLISSISLTNQALVDRTADRILNTGAKRVGFWGLAFKPSTDDLRESPFVLLAERLLGKGVQLTIFDPAVHTTRLMGGNKAYIRLHLPHLEKLLTSKPEDLATTELVVVAHPAPQDALHHWLGRDILLFDLAGTTPRPTHTNYHTIT